jgi:hypothetical protein
VCGISELSLVPSIPMCSTIMIFLCVHVCFDVMYSGEYNVFDVTLSTCHDHRTHWCRRY